MSSTFQRPVINCARCGKSHLDKEQVTFEELSNPPEHTSHVGVCPTSGQPILMLVRSEVVNCRVKGCVNAVGDGKICGACLAMLERGKIGPTESFLKNLIAADGLEEAFIVGGEDSFGPYYLESMEQGIGRWNVNPAFAFRFTSREQADLYVTQRQAPRRVERKFWSIGVFVRPVK